MTVFSNVTALCHSLLSLQGRKEKALTLFFLLTSSKPKATVESNSSVSGKSSGTLDHLFLPLFFSPLLCGHIMNSAIFR